MMNRLSRRAIVTVFFLSTLLLIFSLDASLGLGFYLVLSAISLSLFVGLLVTNGASS